MILWFILALALLLIGLLSIYLRKVTHLSPPRPKDTDCEQWERAEAGPGLMTIGNNWLSRSDSGLYELYVEGTPYTRGVVNGKLAKELICLQEDYFSAQIEQLVPSPFYLHFLKYLVGWFNRNLPGRVTEEYKEEIYGISRSASFKYGYIGKPYQRILNYHAAHDIGHALQSVALVGCTSFGTWGKRSENGSLIIGRNFDFYVGEDFALNKIVQFEAPSEGYKFASITWGGFIGVVSGMNEKGLTITINAAKSSIPRGSATPVSLVAREILQYAHNIEEAVRIAGRRMMFVSESFLVGSLADGKAVLIEKTPASLEVYDPGSDRICCANHFQSAGLGQSETNKADMASSASVDREARLEELLNETGPNTVEKTIRILRDFKGTGGRDIGLGNEKTLNQFIGHHSIVFEPAQLRFWVSTAPWQEGRFMCYDLTKVLAIKSERTRGEIREVDLDIAEDSFVHSPVFKDFISYRAMVRQMEKGEQVNLEALVAANPHFFHAYVLAGKDCYRRKEYVTALSYYTQALTKEVATERERNQIVRQIALCKKKMDA